MAALPQNMCEIHSIGSQTRERMIGLRGSPALAEFGIHLAGISEARAGFSWARLHPEDTQLLAAVSGEGEVFVHGKWERMGPGFAYWTPPGAPHAYRAVRGRKWTVCWVIYAGRLPASAGTLPGSPEVIPAASSLLWHAVGGACDAETQDTELWVRLVHHTVLRILQAARRGGSRLTALWNAVLADLAHPWTLGEMARQAGMSREHLRRVSLLETGVSPLRHVTRLRIGRAAELLSFSPDKLAVIAERVGYGDPFAFSAAFKREMRTSPAAYRKSPPGAEGRGAVSSA
ncbi:MAG: AraC family transcriptional regulator [Chthoniobacteraceae bacterium]|nr:AraC family transcriptional regulator [Chthoniobacteraceae bacterium]